MEDDMPPPPSPPHPTVTAISHENISRQGSLERGYQRKRRESVERESFPKEMVSNKHL